MEPFHNPSRLDKVRSACISVFVVFVPFLSICLAILNLFCAIALRSCIAAFAVMFVLFYFSFTSLFNTVINSSHRYYWFANRLWLQ